MKRIVASLAACATLPGCAPAPTPAPAPQPTWTCTPEAGGDPYPCSERDHQTMQAKDALYLEAEQVYREFMAEYTKTLHRGSVPTERLKELVADDLKDSYIKHFANLHDQKVIASGEPRIIYVKRATGISSKGSEVAIETCLDGTEVRGETPNEKPYFGERMKATFFLKTYDGSLRLIHQTSIAEPTAC